MSRERVSVVVPLYNHAEYIGQALDSLLAQDDPDLEILVVDDGSTDGGDELVEKQYVPLGVHLMRQSRNGCGTTRALNTALSQATGTFICWLSADDWFLPGKISQQRTVYAETFGDSEGVLHASPGYISHDLEYALKSAGLPEVEVRKQFQQGGSVSWQESAQNPPFDQQLFYFFLFNYINGITVFLPRSLFQKYGFFSEAFPLSQDYEFWFRLAWQGIRFHVMPEACTYSRMHAGNLGRYRSDIPAEIGVIVRAYSELATRSQLQAALLAQGFEDQLALLFARLMQHRQLFDYELIWLEKASQYKTLPPAWEHERQRLQAIFGQLKLPQKTEAVSTECVFLMYLSVNTLSTWRWYMCLTHFFQAFQEHDPVRLVIWVPPGEVVESLQHELEARLEQISDYLGGLPDLVLDVWIDQSIQEALSEADVLIPIGSPDELEGHLIYHARKHHKCMLFHATATMYQLCLQARGSQSVDYAEFYRLGHTKSS